MKVIGFGCGPWRWYRGVGEIHMNKGRVGEERGGKETDGCPLTVGLLYRLSMFFLCSNYYHLPSVSPRFTEHHIGYKIILMAYIVQKTGFMASREYNYLNER
jgi:hypothetical protein